MSIRTRAAGRGTKTMRSYKLRDSVIEGITKLREQIADHLGTEPEAINNTDVVESCITLAAELVAENPKLWLERLSTVE